MTGESYPPPGKTWADLRKQGVCRFCAIPLFGWSEAARDLCGDGACRTKADRESQEAA